jgi:glycosyltransferase involved in cell wall biosynthesis
VSSPSQPDFCIVTPALNKATLIERSIESVLTQSGVSCDYCVADGGSKDGTREILGKYSGQLRWFSEGDASQYAAVNKGVGGSASRFMGVLNVDDVYLPDTLSMVRAIFEAEPKVEWIAPKQLLFVNGADRITSILPNQERTTLNDCLLEWKVPSDYAPLLFMPASGIFWRRELWARAGGKLNSAFHFAGEMDLWCRFLALGARPLFIDLPMVAIRDHTFRSEGVFRTVIAKEAAQIFREHHFAPRPASQQWLILRYRTFRRSLEKRLRPRQRKVLVEWQGRTISGEM